MASSDFLDEARIHVASGKGGDGAVHFRREKFVPLGGPDGGDGGNGGSIILQAETALNTLHAFRHRRHFVADPGAPGGRNRRHGKSAPDVIVDVPVGTVIHDDETNAIIGDLGRARDQIALAKGGKGGLGNSHFATSRRQAPNFAEKGEPGQERWFRLELKLVADVGLVGLPNAGKSTLLASMSAARPKIADYPFTTLSPNLGVVAVDDYSFVMADIPGLIEGAHAGRGMGDTFLRHVERTRLLVRVLDGSAADPIVDFDEAGEELRLYRSDLLSRPQIVAMNKMDLPDAQARFQEVSRVLQSRGLDVYAISAVTGEGLKTLVAALRQNLERLGQREDHTSQSENHEFVFGPRDRPHELTIERKRSTFSVHGAHVERLVGMTDFESQEAIEHLQRRLKRLGLFQALEREGVRAGNKVRIGAYELIWEGELEQSLSTPAGQKGSGSRRRNGRGTGAYPERRRG